MSVKVHEHNNSLAASNLKDSVFCNSLSRKIWLCAWKDLGSIIKHWRVLVTYRLGYVSLWQAVYLQLVASDRIKEIIERVNVSKFSRTWTLLSSWAQKQGEWRFSLALELCLRRKTFTPPSVSDSEIKNPPWAETKEHIVWERLRKYKTIQHHSTTKEIALISDDSQIWQLISISLCVK